MSWKKDKLSDPQYLMDMRRPTFIVSRAIGLTTQRVIGAQPRWLFFDLLTHVKELIATRPQIPTITLPSDLSEAITNEVQNISDTNSMKKPKKRPTIEKRISRKLREVLGI